MVTQFSSQAEHQYLYDSITNQILRYSDESGAPEDSHDGTLSPELEKTLGDFGVTPHMTTAIAANIEEESLRRDLDKGWKSLNLSITEECNNRCTYCIYSGAYYYERCHAHRFMNWETVKKAVDLYIAHSAHVETRWITFYGGEPLLNWDVIVQAVAYVQERSPRTHLHISTNGILLDEAKIGYIISHGISLNISYDGPKNVHDSYRVSADGQGTWDRLMTVFDTIRHMDPAYFNSQLRLICTVAPPYNLPQISEYFEKNPALKERLFFVGQVDPHDTAFFNDMSPIERKLLEEIKKYHADTIRQEYIKACQQGEGKDHFGKYLYEPMLRLIHNRVMHPGPVRRLMGCCFPGEHQVFVTIDGNLYPCQRCGGCNFMKIGTLDGGLDADGIVRHINDFIGTCQEQCSTCWCCHLCTHCYVTGKKGEEPDPARREEACEATRRYIRECLKIYTSVREVSPDAFDFLLDDGQAPEVYDVNVEKCRIV
jgi:uncharacterized protein